MRNLKTNELIRSIAKDHGVSTEQAKTVLMSVFEYLKYNITEVSDREEVYFPAIRLPNFAMFFVRESTKEKFKLMKEKEKDESDRV